MRVMDERAKVSEEGNVVDIRMERSNTCARCHMLVARFAPQVIATSGVYHRECFEAWYFGRYGRRPALLAGPNSDRHRFRVRDKAA